MRPLHAVLLVLALVLVAGLAWLLVRGDELDARSAAPLADARATLAQPAAAGPSADLAEPSAAVAEGTGRARVEPVADAQRERGTPAAESERPERVLAGRFVDTLGRPVAGVHVYVRPGSRGSVDVGEAYREGDARVRRSEPSGSDGRFEVALPSGTEMALAVRGSGWAPLTRTVVVPAAGSHDVGDLELVAGVRLSGRVVDADGFGVAGAAIADLSGAVRPEDAVLFAVGPRGERVATTDAEGRFTVDRLASGPWRLLATVEHAPPALAEGRTSRPGETVTGVEIRLAPAASIEGRVVGAPELDGLEVVARYVEGPGGTTREALGAAASADRRRVEVAADGRFTLPGLRRDALYRLTLEDGAEELFASSRAEPVTVPAGARDVELCWRRTSALVFRVVDDATGAPVERFVARAGSFLLAALEDEDGRARTVHEGGRVRFELEANGLGADQRLEVSAPGYAVHEREGLRVPEGGELDLGTISLRPVPAVRVLVLDVRTGAPVEGARVRLEPARSSDDGILRARRAFGGPAGPDDARSATTPASGRVRLSSLPGEAAVLRVTHADHAPWSSGTLVLPAAEDTELEARLGRGGTVEITVLDADDAPVAGVAIEHRAPDGVEADVPLLASGRTTDADGRLAFRRLAPGEHRFRVHAGGEAMIVESDDGDRMSVSFRRAGGGPTPADRPWSSVVVESDGEHELVLVTEARGGLRGRVTEAGAPLAGATLRLAEEGGSGALDGDFPGLGGGGPSARTDGEGRYAFEGVAAGEYELRVTHPDRAMPASVAARVASGVGELDVHLTRATLVGRVTDEAGEPLEGVRVSAQRHTAGGTTVQRTMMFVGAGGGAVVSTSTGGGGETFTDADGRYALHGVEPEVDLVVRAALAGRQPGRSEPVRVAPDQTRGGVDVELPLGGAIALSVSRGDGAPGRMCFARVQRLERGEPQGAPDAKVTDDAGRARFEGLEPGTWRVTTSGLSFSPGDGSPEEIVQEVEVEVGATREVTATVP